MSEISLALRYFVGVVRECIVDTAAVDIESLAEVLHTDAGAFDVPAGVTDTPRAIPFKLLVVELGFCKPKHEIRLVFLVSVFLNALANTDLKVFLAEIVENVILREL